MQRNATDNTTRSSAPGRVYSFIVLTLASLLLGITVLSAASQVDTTAPIAETDMKNATLPTTKLAGEPAEAIVLLPRERLPLVLGIAVGVGMIGLIPSRQRKPEKPHVEPTQNDASLVAERTGMPVLAALFPAEPDAATVPQANQLGWLNTIVFAAEITLAVAVCIAIFGCITRSDISQTILQNPLDGYANAVCHATSSLINILN